MFDAWRSPWRKYIDKKLEAKIRETTGMVPSAELSAEDIFIAGYPKSGNTWFQNLAMGAIYGIASDFVPDSVVQRLVPDIDGFAFYTRFFEPMVFKTHALPQAKHRRVVYLMRDGRDVAVSFYKHIQAMSGSSMSMKEFIETTPEETRWHHHVECWLKNPHHADMITIRFEDLHADPLCEMKRFCKFAKLDRSDTILEQAIQKSSFQTMQTKEKVYGWANSAWPAGQSFVRRGQIGSYRDEMPSDALEAFLGQAGPVLQKYGYVND